MSTGVTGTAASHRRRERHETPLSERILEIACVGFAIWTLSCHVTMLLGGSLVAAMVGACLACAASWWADKRFCDRRHQLQTEQAARVSSPPRNEAWQIQVRALGLAAATGVILTVAVTKDIGILWAGLVVCGTLGIIASMVGFETSGRAVFRARLWEIILWILAVACVMIALSASRPDADDSFYVNLAVASAEEPLAPLTVVDNLHGIDGLPVHLPLYWLHSYEQLNAAVSLLTGLPAIVTFHFVASAVGALLVPLAFAALFRQLTPRYWIWTTIAVLVVLIAAGETHRWYGNFSLVRIWQGKAIYLMIFAPLISAYGIRFGLDARPRTWFLLAAAQIASIGATSSALWSGPVIAATAIASSSTVNRQGLRRWMLGMVTSLYAVILGLTFKVIINGDFSNRFASLTEAETTLPTPAALWQLAIIAVPVFALAAVILSRKPTEPAHRRTASYVVFIAGTFLAVGVAISSGIAHTERVQGALTTVLGEDRLLILAQVCLLSAWTFFQRGLGQRFAAICCFTAGTVFLNPFLAEWLTENLTGPSYWRIMWVIPIPVLISLVLSAPIGWSRRAAHRIVAPMFLVALLFGFSLLVPKYGGLSSENEVTLNAHPSLKVPPVPYHWARMINSLLPAGSRVVAPKEISTWIPVMEGHCYPLVVRHYLNRQRSILSDEDVDRRKEMGRIASGRNSNKAAVKTFRRGLYSFSIRAVCLRSNRAVEPIRSLLDQLGFVRRAADDAFELWVRPKPFPPLPEPDGRRYSDGGATPQRLMSRLSRSMRHTRQPPDSLRSVTLPCSSTRSRRSAKPARTRSSFFPRRQSQRRQVDPVMSAMPESVVD